MKEPRGMIGDEILAGDPNQPCGTARWPVFVSAPKPLRADSVVTDKPCNRCAWGCLARKEVEGGLDCLRFR